MRARDALLLGLVQGPTEVLPISSSAHLALLVDTLDLPEVQRDAELRNSLEVALHAGAAAGLLILLRGELARGARELDGGRLAALALALTPPAIAGYLLEQRLERRMNWVDPPKLLAAGLALGGGAMVWADAGSAARRLADIRPGDGLALGLAQALALLPGVSRNGAALTAARARGFAREDAHALSWRVGLPLLAGAAALKTYRLGRERATLAPGARRRLGLSGETHAVGLAPALAVGAGAAFVSTLACAPMLGPGLRRRPLWPFAAYRAALALVASR